MSIRILPQEFLFQESLTPIQVQTTVPKELLDDGQQLLQHVRHFNLAKGTKITVQVLNEAKDTLLHEAEFRVTAAVESQHLIEDDYGSKSKPRTQYQVERWTAWKSSSLVPAVVEVEPERAPEHYVSGEGETKWNLGKQAYEVIVAGQVVASVAKNEGETKEEFKARALAIAAGSEPLPKAA